MESGCRSTSPKPVIRSLRVLISALFRSAAVNADSLLRFLGVGRGYAVFPTQPFRNDLPRTPVRPLVGTKYPSITRPFYPPHMPGTISSVSPNSIWQVEVPITISSCPVSRIRYQAPCICVLSANASAVPGFQAGFSPPTLCLTLPLSYQADRFYRTFFLTRFSILGSNALKKSLRDSRPAARSPYTPRNSWSVFPLRSACNSPSRRPP